MKLRKQRAKIALIAALLSSAGCATNPVTGEQDFVLMSEQQEISQGRQAHAQVLQHYTEYPNPALQNYVDNLGQQLANSSHRQHLNYQFTVLDSSEINAFALPGGYIYITRGMLAYLNTEAELAAVLGHEIGHVTARHSVRQHSATQATQMGLTLGALFVPGMNTNQLASTLGTVLLRGYGREHELEADRLGAEYLARTGRSPDAMLDVIKVLKNQETFEVRQARAENREPRVYHGLFSTHPDNDDRLQEVVGAAAVLKSNAPVEAPPDRYLEMIDDLVYGESSKEGVLRGRNFYHPELGFGIRFPPGWRIRNLPTRIIATAPGGAAVMAMSLQNLDRQLSPKDFMIHQMGLKNLVAEGPLTSNNLQGYSAVSRVNTNLGKRDVRFNVIFLDNNAYIIAGTVKDSGNIPLYDAAFLETARSFHRLTPQERAAATPLRLELIRAGNDTTFGKLANESPLPNYQEERLRLLNGMYPVGEPHDGQLIKVIRQGSSVSGT